MRSLFRFLAITALAAATASCGKTAGDSSASTYLVIDSLTAVSGATTGGNQSATLGSDVLTCVQKTVNGQQQLVPTIFADPGAVKLRLAAKDVTFTPTTNNEVTITRYHVQFIRADGRNTQGVDVPYAFDGAVTATVTTAGVTIGFDLVRAQAKQEAPLIGLVGTGTCGSSNGGAIAISTIAQVTFYGTDRVGNAVSVMGQISVNFANWGDPA